jgi:hypothetical protein
MHLIPVITVLCATCINVCVYYSPWYRDFVDMPNKPEWREYYLIIN